MDPELKAAIVQSASPQQQLVAALAPLSRYERLVFLSLYVLPDPPSESLLSEMSGLDLVDVALALEGLMAWALVREMKKGLVVRRFEQKGKVDESF